MREDMKAPVREAIHLHKSIKPIPGSAEDDQKEINKKKSTRLTKFVCAQFRQSRTSLDRCNELDFYLLSHTLKLS
jgi:hypothetical protein